jgi:prefoldin subunit 5
MKFGFRVAVLTLVCGTSAFAVWHFGGRPIVDEHSMQWRERLNAIRATSEALAKDIAHNNTMLAECKGAMETVENLSRHARAVSKTTQDTLYAADSASHAAHNAAATANRLTADIAAFTKTLDSRYEIIMRRLDAIEKRLDDGAE